MWEVTLFDTIYKLPRFDFIVTDINGDVTVNNQVVPIGFKMPGCSVLTFGKINGLRKFVTFDVSNPEVMP